MRKKGYVTVDDIKRQGFFPMGLGPAVTGEIVSECQCVHDMALDNMQLSSTDISAAFGSHEFILRTNMELQMMELVIMVDSSLLITEGVLDLVKNKYCQLLIFKNSNSANVIKQYFIRIILFTLLQDSQDVSSFPFHAFKPVLHALKIPCFNHLSSPYHLKICCFHCFLCSIYLILSFSMFIDSSL